MFDSPLVWCAVLKGWVALDEDVATCRKMQDCEVAVCPKSNLFATVAMAARQTAACADAEGHARETPVTDLRIF